MIKVKVQTRRGDVREVEATDGDYLMHALRDHDLDIEAVCGGACSCATCHIYVAPEWLSQLPPMAAEEAALLEDLVEVQSNSRLCCQVMLTPALDGLTVSVAPPEG